MAKLRLNKEHRELLATHARKFVDSLPLSPDETQELRAAELRRDTVAAAVIAKARAVVAAHLPETDMAVLRRYDATSKSDDARFIVQDNHDLVFKVDFYDDLTHDRNWDRMTYEEQRKASSKASIDRENARVELPKWGRSGDMIPCDMDLYDMHKDFKMAKKEEDAARRRLGEKQQRLRRTLETLIGGARTYEDVFEIWPAASDVRHMLGGRQDLTVLSEDAISEIGEAMKMHHKQLAAAEKVKSLPAPEPTPMAVVVMEEPIQAEPGVVTIDAEPVEGAAA